MVNLLLYNPADSTDLTTFSILKNGVVNVWSYDLRVPKLYGSTTTETSIIPVSLYLTLNATDYLNFTYNTTLGTSPVVMSGTTLSITSLVVGSNKSFVIDHPDEPDERYLVHISSESEDASVFYRGISHITNGNNVTVDLPKYVSHFYNFTIQITQIFDGKFVSFATSKVVDNKFTVYSNNGNSSFYWIVHGTRFNIETCPLKKSVTVKGDPYSQYKYI